MFLPTARCRIAPVLMAALPVLALACGPRRAVRTPIRDVRLDRLAQKHLEEVREHLLPEGLVVYRMDWPREPVSLYRRAAGQADGAYFQGLLVGALCMRAELTGKPEDADEARRAYLALRRCMALSGYPGLVARTYGKTSPDQKGLVARTDSSGDQVTGFVWGTYWALRLLGDEKIQAGAAEDSLALVRHLHKHQLKLHQRENQPQEFGQYDADVLDLIPVGHRAAGALAVALLALETNPDHPETKAFLDGLIRRDYHKVTSYFYSWFPHRAMNTINFLLNLYLVRELDASPHRRKFYKEGFEAAWSLTHGWQMAMYAALYRAAGGSHHLGDVTDSLIRLRNLPDRHTWYRNEQRRWRLAVVPIEERPSCTSYWSNSPRTELASHDGVIEPVRIARIDFLAAYWFGRYTGLYSEDE